MSKIVMLVGIPGAGKSYIAEELAKKEDYLVFASDKIREELYKNVADQTNNAVVFKTLEDRIIKSLKENKNCIYDATNINAKRRTQFLKKLKEIKCQKICVVVLTQFELCLENNKSRGRVVPEEVIENMYINFDIPKYEEGWDEIQIIRKIKEDCCYDNFFKHIYKGNLQKKVIIEATYDILNKYRLIFAGDINRLKNLMKASMHCILGSECYNNFNKIAAYLYLLFEKENEISNNLAECLYIVDLIRNFSIQPYSDEERKELKKIISEHEYYDLLILNEGYLPYLKKYYERDLLEEDE